MLPDIDAAIASKSMWSWFLCWNWIHTIPNSGNQQYATDSDGNEIVGSGGSKYPVQTELYKWIEVYNHENVLTLDDSPFHTHVFNDNTDVCDVCGAVVETSGGEYAPPVTPPNEPTHFAPEKSNGGLVAAVAVLSVLLTVAIAVIVVLCKVFKKKSS